MQKAVISSSLELVMPLQMRLTVPLKILMTLTSFRVQTMISYRYWSYSAQIGKRGSLTSLYTSASKGMQVILEETKQTAELLRGSIKRIGDRRSRSKF
jgi:hypothetical protein